jgi:hypothetical protein
LLVHTKTLVHSKTLLTPVGYGRAEKCGKIPKEMKLVARGLAPVELIVTIPHKTNDEGQDNGNK